MRSNTSNRAQFGNESVETEKGDILCQEISNSEGDPQLSDLRRKLNKVIFSKVNNWVKYVCMFIQFQL